VNDTLLAIVKMHVDRQCALWEVRAEAVERVVVIEIKCVLCEIRAEAEETVEH
jgi:hypothetical protein